MCIRDRVKTAPCLVEGLDNNLIQRTAYKVAKNLASDGIFEMDFMFSCPEHSAGSPDRLRGSAAERGYDAKWRRARKRFLQRHPLCANCLSQGVLTPATVVDHIVPHRGDRALFWDENNCCLLYTSPCRLPLFYDLYLGQKYACHWQDGLPDAA